jgi:hypothetical protein
MGKTKTRMIPTISIGTWKTVHTNRELLVASIADNITAVEIAVPN